MAEGKLVVRREFKANDILEKALGRSIQPPPETLPTETRQVRRGKFFLSDYEQRTFGSLRKPIFEYYCHGVVVGETTQDEKNGGLWCYAAHNDFDLVPEFMRPSDWPEYTRTPTGWVRKDGTRRLEDGTVSSEEFQKAHPKPTLDHLLSTISTLKRLK